MPKTTNDDFLTYEMIHPGLFALYTGVGAPKMSPRQTQLYNMFKSLPETTQGRMIQGMKEGDVLRGHVIENEYRLWQVRQPHSGREVEYDDLQNSLKRSV